QLDRFTAAAIEQPDLIALRLAGTRRGERQILPVGTEARSGLALGARRDLPLVLAVEADRPDVPVAGLVLFDVDLRHDERDALPVGRALRVADVFQFSQVV